MKAQWTLGPFSQGIQVRGFRQADRCAMNLLVTFENTINHTLHSHLPHGPHLWPEGRVPKQGSEPAKSLTGVTATSWRRESRTPSSKDNWEEFVLKTIPRTGLST